MRLSRIINICGLLVLSYITLTTIRVAFRPEEALATPAVRAQLARPAAPGTGNADALRSATARATAAENRATEAASAVDALRAEVARLSSIAASPHSKASMASDATARASANNADLARRVAAAEAKASAAETAALVLHEKVARAPTNGPKTETVLAEILSRVFSAPAAAPQQAAPPPPKAPQKKKRPPHKRWNATARKWTRRNATTPPKRRNATMPHKRAWRPKRNATMTSSPHKRRAAPRRNATSLRRRPRKPTNATRPQ